MKKCLPSLLAALSVPLFAQTASQSQPAPAPQTATPDTSLLSTRSALVLAPALVRNKNGDLVFTLTANDFVLTDDGIPQKLNLEQDADGQPLALVVVIEIGGAGAREFNKFSSIAPPLAPMLASIVGNVRHQVAVVAFDSQPTLLQDFTSNLDSAADAVADLTPG